jgi:hypothetical protein
MYLLVEGLNLKSMAGQGDESTGKDEGEVKSTPSIYNQEVAPPLVSSTDSLIQKVQSFIFLYFILFCFLF